MSKLSEIVFKPIIQKEIESFGHKVLLKTLDTKDNIELDIEVSGEQKFSTKDLLVLGVKILSRAIISIDGVVPDNAEETKSYLEKQPTEVVFDLLNKYQSLSGVTEKEIKN